MVELRWIEIDVVFLGEPAEARHVEDPGHGFELLFEHPVFDLFLTDQVVVGTLNYIAIDFSNWIFGRQIRA